MVSACAREVGLDPDALEAGLFADLPGERSTLALEVADPGALALRANLLLAQSLVARASRVTVDLEGNARAVIRHASLRGLLCSVLPGRAPDGARLELSGPFALFRRTLLYGRALASLVPVLAWTRRFRLVAEAVLGDRTIPVALASGDPRCCRRPPA